MQNLGLISLTSRHFVINSLCTHNTIHTLPRHQCATLKSAFSIFCSKYRLHYVVNYLFIKEVLKRTNAEVIHANNGEEAIEFVKDRKDLSLILMDIQLPIMNGFEAIEVLNRMNNKIPIIAQTAYAMSNDKYACQSAGCIDYITKPIDNIELLKKIIKYI